MNPQIEQTEKTNKAISLIDRLLPVLPDYGVFHFGYYTKGILNWSAEDLSEVVSNSEHIAYIMLSQMQYIDEKTKDYYFALNDKGRAAKTKGGHFAYQKFIGEENIKKRIQQERKDSAEELDLKIKQWTFKARYTPYIFSTLALIGTIVSLTISFNTAQEKKKQAPAIIKPTGLDTTAIEKSK